MNSLGNARENTSLPFLSSEERLKAYQLLLDGCSHLWSKDKLQTDKAHEVLSNLIPLTKSDPYFLARLTSYALQKTKNKDLQVFTTYTNSLSSADGLPFSPGSKYFKPNLRYISAAAVQMLDPKVASRVLELSMLKYSVPEHLNEARHFPEVLRTAFKKYLKYREANINITKGIKKAGLGNILKDIYRSLHSFPSDEVASVLRWKQKDREITFEDSPYKDFEKLTDLEIAERIRNDKLPVLGVIGALPRQVSPVIAIALLEQATGNQAVILRSMFEDTGVLKDPEVLSLYKEKIKTAKTALDRVETLSETASEEVKKVMKSVKAEKRQEEMKGLGKIYLMLDFSPSMEASKQFAIERGAIIAECVNDPRNNFAWGTFASDGKELDLPEEFEKDAFEAKLFAIPTRSATDCFALYPNARKFGAEVDILVTDQEHNMGDLTHKIKTFHTKYPEFPKPKAAVIINFSVYANDVKEAYESNGIPVSIMKPDTLKESALVVDAVRSAIMGPISTIDNIMNTDLLKLPQWYFTF